jgi:cytochrome c-type biogenesis protein CcmH
MKPFTAAIAVWLMLSPAWAVPPDEMLKDAGLEARARAISSELRCLVCQNQSIDDSDASLAKDLRIIVRERLVAGDSDAAIKDYLVQRYGTFVLLRPPLGFDTALLWALPFLAVIAGGAYMLASTRRARRGPEAAPLSPAELAQLDARLDDAAGG